MLAYYATALSLKAFGSSRVSRGLYRKLGNLKNRLTTHQIPEKYFDMAPGMLEELDALGAIRDGIDLFELGTGWVHWESVLLRNCYRVRATLYDVWDNRNFDRFRSFATQLCDPDVRRRLGLGNGEALALMQRVAAAESFEEAYQILGFDYLVDPAGKLEAVAGREYDLIVSRDVGEHLRREDLPDIIRNSYERLRPKGWAFHQVVLTDHAMLYAKRTHPKEYLRFDPATHRKWLSSGIQYTNLVQIPEWVALFEAAGFACVRTKRVGTCDLTGLKVHPAWSGIPEEDLACTVVQFYLQKR